jgi:hypothetical protein
MQLIKIPFQIHKEIMPLANSQGTNENVANLDH